MSGQTTRLPDKAAFLAIRRARVQDWHLVSPQCECACSRQVQPTGLFVWQAQTEKQTTLGPAIVYNGRVTHVARHVSCRDQCRSEND